MRVVAVMIGGAIGALCRWGVTLLLAPPTGFPLATFFVNVSGAFGLGFAGVVLIERLPPSRHLRPLIATGFFGAYTTFSAIAVDGVQLLEAGQILTAVGYWVATLLVGQMAGVYGMWLGRLQLPGRSR